MIYNKIEFHNIEEAREVPEGGVRLQRVPEHVRLKLNEGAQMRVLQPDNAEVRFLSDGDVTKVTLSSEGETDVVLFHGLFDGRQRITLTREPKTIEVTPPAQLNRLPGKYLEGMAFSPRVYRLILGGRNREPVIFHGMEGDNVRPPEPRDLPSIRLLTYGTSITHGFDAEGPHLTYVAWTERRLGADLINLGLGGAAHCEPELSDYIAGRKDWDIATLALSVNMQGFPMHEFYKRVSYMVNTVAGSDSRRPVAAITLYTYSRDLGIDIDAPGTGGKPEEYRQALRDAVSACPHPNIRVLEGREMLSDFSGLTLDLVHPGDYGMEEMGRNISKNLKALLAERTH